MAQGEMIKDNVVELGIWLHPEGYEEQALYKQDLKSYGMRGGYENGNLIVPPHGYTMTQGFHSFDHPVRIDSFQPHGHLRMNAVLVLIVLTVGGKLFGVWGLILGLPVVNYIFGHAIRIRPQTDSGRDRAVPDQARLHLR